MPAMTSGMTFTDVSMMQKLSTTGDAPDDLAAAAKQFESLFIDMMLKAAREAGEVLAKDNPLESFETRMHREMLDHQYAVTLSESGGVGLAPIIMRQLSPRLGPVEGNETGEPMPLPRAVPHALPGAEPATGRPLNAPLRELNAASLAARRGSGFTPRSFALPSDQQFSLPASTTAPTLDPKGARSKSVGSGQPAAPASSATQEVTASSSRRSLFDSPRAFIEAVLPVVRRHVEGTPFSALGVVAQAALETGWGRRVIADPKGESSNNLFGIKSSSSARSSEVAPAGVKIATVEVRDGVARRELASFKRYPDLDAAVADLVSLLTNSPRYEAVRASGRDAGRYVEGLQADGYATDPDYADKLKRVLASEPLTRLAGDTEQ